MESTEPTSPRLAQLIEIDRRSIRIDGEPFPWHIEQGSIFLDVDHTDMPSVTLKIYADRVTVDNDSNAWDPRLRRA
jgi:methyl coenzyme M reductase subunit D